MQGIQARLSLPEEAVGLLDELCAQFRLSLRKAYAAVKRGALDPGEARKWFVSEKNWTEPQVKSLVLSLGQLLAGNIEQAKHQLEQARLKQISLLGAVKSLDEAILAFEKNPFPTKKSLARLGALQQKRFYKHRKLLALGDKEKRLEKEVEKGGASRVFGSMKLLRQRSQLGEVTSPFESVQHWRESWERSREGSLTFVGDGSASFGNQIAQIRLPSQEERQGNVHAPTMITLRLSESQAQRRLTQKATELGVSVEKLPGKLLCKRLEIPVQLCSKFEEMLRQAQSEGRPITVSLQKKLTPKGEHQEKRKAQGAQFSRAAQRKRSWQEKVKPGKPSKKPLVSSPGLSLHREVRGLTAPSSPNSEASYYLHASFETTPANLRTSRKAGALGIDFGSKSLAYALVKSDGNVAKDGQGRRIAGELFYPNGKFGPHGHAELSAEEFGHWLRHACLFLSSLALKYGACLAIEHLDFVKKKSQLGEREAGYARMLSMLRTAGFEEALRSRARKDGVALHKVNPAYTSVAGAIKYSQRHGLGFDEAAALVIARAAVLGKDPNENLPPLPTRNKQGNKLSPKFLRQLSQKRESKVIHFVERVVSPRSLPGDFQRKIARQSKELSWKHYRKALGPRKGWSTQLSRRSRSGISPPKGDLSRSARVSSNPARPWPSVHFQQIK